MVGDIPYYSLHFTYFKVKYIDIELVIETNEIEHLQIKRGCYTASTIIFGTFMYFSLSKVN